MFLIDSLLINLCHFQESGDHWTRLIIDNICGPRIKENIFGTCWYSMNPVILNSLAYQLAVGAGILSAA